VADKIEFDHFFRIAMQFLDQGNGSEAIEVFTKLIALAPDARAFCYRGLAYFMGKEYDKALADYTSTIRLDDPSIPEICYFRETLHGLLGNNGEAIQDLTKAIELNGETWLVEAYYYRRANFGAIGEFDMAVDDMMVAAGAGYKPAQEFLKKRGLRW
jgi:tetratricopeptide (TPR) repeat protein